MRVLGIDTSTGRASVGVVEAGLIVAERHEGVRGSHAVSLFPLIQSLLEECAWEITDLGAIAVSRGPGTFTGLRISASVAKGLALATGARLIGVSTLEALARASKSDGIVCPMLDARRGEIYWALFELSGEHCRRLHDDSLTSPPVALAALPTPCTVIGDATVAYAALLSSHRNGSLRALPFPEFGPSGAIVAQIAFEQLRSGVAEEDDTADPVYIRPSEAELKFAL